MRILDPVRWVRKPTMWATGAKGLVVLRGAGTADRAQQQCKPLPDPLNLVLVGPQTDDIWSKYIYRIL